MNVKTHSLVHLRSMLFTVCKLDLNFIKETKFREKLHSSMCNRILLVIKDKRLYNVDINNIMEKGHVLLFVAWRKM